MKNGILIVGVQPGYHHQCKDLVQGVARLINSTTDPIVVMYANSHWTGDSEQDVRDYLFAHGARSERLAKLNTWIGTEFGYLRSWMGSVNQDLIVAVGQHMYETGAMSSLDVDSSTPGMAVCDRADDIILPEFCESWLEKYDSLEICGGGPDVRHLEEMEIWLRIKKKSFKRIPHLVY